MKSSIVGIPAIALASTVALPAAADSKTKKIHECGIQAANEGLCESPIQKVV